MKVGTLAALFVLSGVDGFLLLEALREAGARPFFFVLLILLIVWAGRRQLFFRWSGVAVLTAIVTLATVGMALRGSHLDAFAGKAPLTQYIAQGGLFCLGFCPLALRVRIRVEESTLERALMIALIVHCGVAAADGLSIVSGLPRLTEGSFVAPGGRVFPSGLFSEPSYAAAYTAIILPAVLYRRSVFQVTIVSLFVSVLWFIGEVRSFFPVYAVGMGTLLLCRSGFNWRAAVGLMLAGVAMFAVAMELNLSSVENSLSSAYRLGNALVFVQHALHSDWVIGSGFGSTHFLYPGLDFPTFIYVSNEFQSMLSGEGFRVPVFNLWVRLAVEIGIPATVLLIAVISRALFSRRVLPQVKIMLAASMTFGLATDSYIYGTFSLALLLALSVINVSNTIPVRVKRRRRAATATATATATLA